MLSLTIYLHLQVQCLCDRGTFQVVPLIATLIVFTVLYNPFPLSVGETYSMENMTRLYYITKNPVLIATYSRVFLLLTLKKPALIHPTTYNEINSARNMSKLGGRFISIWAWRWTWSFGRHIYCSPERLKQRTELSHACNCDSQKTIINVCCFKPLSLCYTV